MATQPADPIVAPDAALYRAFFESVTVGAALADAHSGRFLRTNRLLQDLLGRSEEELQALSIRDVTHPDDLDAQSDLFHRLWAGEIDRFEIEKRYVRPDGSVVWGAAEVTLIRAPDGTAAYTVGLIRDITDAQRTRSELAESESRYRNIFQSSGAGILVIRDRRYIEVNAAACRMLARTREEILGQSTDAFIPAYYRERRDQALERLLVENRWSGEFPLERPDGLWAWLHWDVTHDPQSGETQAILTDLSEQKAAEQLMREASETLQQTTDALPVLISYVDREYRYRFVNRAYEQWFGLRREEIVGRTPSEVLGEAAFQAAKPHFDRALAGEQVTFERLLPYQHGGERYVRVQYVPRRHPGGDVQGLFALVVDITETRAAEEARRQSENRLGLALRGANAGAWELDLATGQAHWSSELRELMRIADDLPATLDSFADFIHPDDRPAALEAAANAAETGHLDTEFRVVRPDGSVAWLSSVGIVERGPDGTPVRLLGINQDITRRKFVEDRLRHSEERFRSLFEQSPITIQTFAPDGSAIGANPAWEQLWGASIEDLRGYNVLQDPQLVQKGMMPYIEAAFRGEPAQVPPTRYDPAETGKPGRPRWVEARIYPVKNLDGDVREVVLLLEDVTVRVEAEEARKRSEEQFRTLADSMPQIVFSRPADGPLDYANPRWEEYFGLGIAEAQEDRWRPILHPEDYTRVVEGSTASMERKEPFACELRLRRHDGRFRWHVCRMSPLFDANGQVVRWFGTHNDIHDQKESERRQSFRADMAEAMRRAATAREVAEAACRLTAVFLGVSRGSCGLFYEEEDRVVLMDHAIGVPSIAGEHRISFLPKDSVHALRAGELRITEDAVAEKSPDEYERVFRPTSTRATVVCPLVKEGRLLGSFAVSHHEPKGWTEDEIRLVQEVAGRMGDALERIRAREALRELNDTLEQRVRERTAALRAANEQMESFTYSVSHDLRAPLRAIVSTSRILAEDYGDKVPPEARQQLERQSRAAVKMANLIDDLLRLSRLSRQELERRPLDLSEIAHEVVMEIVKREPAQEIAVNIQPGMQAHGDPHLVRFLIQNLVENAVKFSPTGGTVEVGQSNGFYFVRDQGIGFDMQYAEKIFLPFERLHHDGDFPGTGIGLANVRQIVQRHGGRVWAESHPNQGATFYFTLDPR